MRLTDSVSFVVPVHNGVTTIRATLESIVKQDDGRPVEIVVVDDGGSDGSSELLHHLARSWPLRIVKGTGEGAAAAINVGLRAARFELVCQVDQDVVLHQGWLRALLTSLDNADVAAVQGCYVSDPAASLCVRAMGLDLDQRYAAIAGTESTHVCTGNTLYRASALRQVGRFDESLGYGYDNDISYRLRAAGYRIRLCREAQSTHHWREGLAGYLKQQYGFGYGRLDVVAKHPRRCAGDSVSPVGMMIHPLLMFLAVALWTLAVLAIAAGGPAGAFAWTGCGVAAMLGFERAIAGVKAAFRFRAWTPLVFPFLHLARDVAWVAAVLVWTVRRLSGRSPHPLHSMRPRPVLPEPNRPAA